MKIEINKEDVVEGYNKFWKTVKNEKAVKKFMMLFGIIGIAFYGAGMYMPIYIFEMAFKNIGYVFLLLAIGCFAITFLLKDEGMQNMVGKFTGKSKEKELDLLEEVEAGIVGVDCKHEKVTEPFYFNPDKPHTVCYGCGMEVPYEPSQTDKKEGD